MTTPELLVTVLGAGGGGAALLALIKGLFDWLSGRAARERDRNTNLAAQRKEALKEREDAIRDRDAAFDERDTQAKLRRDSDEYSSSLRRQLIENGITPIVWPFKHTNTDNDNNPEIRSDHG